MKSKRRVLLTIALFIAASSIGLAVGMRYATARGQAPMVTRQEANEFAQKSLQGYLDYLQQSKTPIGRFGFSEATGIPSSAEITLGTPYAVKYIRLTDLQGYKSGSRAPDVNSLLKDANTLWYPVQVNGKTITKMEIVRLDEKLTPGEFGGTRTVEAVVTAEGVLQESMRGQEAETVLVKIPALQATFLLTTQESGDSVLTPAMVYPERFGLVAGKTYKVDEVLPILTKAAQEIDKDLIR